MNNGKTVFSIQTRFKPPRFSHWLLLLVLVLLTTAEYSQSGQDRPQILILNSYHQGEDWTDNEISGILTELRKYYPNLIPAVEALDTKRFPDPGHLVFLKTYLLDKYRKSTFDLIIALDNPALELLVNNSAELFPEVPVVFAGINGYHPGMLAGRANITGVMEKQDVAGTLKMALSLHPEISHVLAIHDYTTSGLAVRRETESALAAMADRVDIRYSAKAPFEDLREELQAMPANGLVLILTYVTDQTGHTFTREESTRLITSHSTAPVYAMHETRLGFGIVGGLLLEGREHGRQAAEIAMRILQGEKTTRIPVEESRSRPVLDYRVLNRLQVPEKNLPADAIVINQPLSLWSRHRTILIPAISAVALLAGLSTMLVILVARMRRTGRTLRKSEEQFRASFDEDSIGRTLTGIDGRLLRANPRFCKMLGYNAVEIVTLNFAEITHPDDVEASHAVVRCLLAGEQDSYRLEKRYLHKDGTHLWVEMTTTLLRDERGTPQYFITGILDISERKRASEALRESEANHKLVLTMMQESLSVIDIDGNFLLANATAARNLTGGRAEELIGKNIRQLVPEEQGRKLLAAYRRTLDSGSPSAQEVRVSLAQGERWFFNTLQPLEYGERRIKAVLSISLDISDRKEAEEALIRQKFLLEKSQEMGLIGTWELDLAKNRLVWTDENCRIFGVPEGSVVTYEIFLEKVHPADREFIDREWQAALAGKPYDIEHRIVLADQVKWVREKAEIHFDGDGRPLFAIGFSQDITERKQAEATLRESEERNRQIIHSSIDGFWRVDAQNRLIEVNEAYCHMSGYSREELLTMTIRDLEALESSEEVARRIRRIIENGSDRFTTSHRRKDGRIFEVEVSIQYRSGEGGGEFAVFLRDVTEKRRLETQLHQAQKMEAIGTLAGGIAHDFNNILGAIIGYSEMIRDDFPPGSSGIHDVNQVIKASHRAKDLVKQILAFSRQTEGQKIPLQPAVIVKEAITLLRSSLPTTITMRQDIDPDTGIILADPTQIHQIVMNLATNAFHAMEVKGGTLTISLQKKNLSRDDLAAEPDLQPGTWVQLSVRDTGEGILPEIRERIFDPFFTTKEVGKGTGLGLSMVYSIVKGCNGSISCDSQLGKGTEFRVLLPALEGHAAQEHESTDLIPHGKEHVLLVDDEEVLVELGQAMLKRLGYHVTTRTNSLDAMITFQNQPDTFDLIFTDQTMPGMTGFDLARRILQIRPQMPIILCTGYSSQIPEDKAKAAGIKGFAYKPLAKKDIGELIRKVLDGKNP